MIGEEAATYLKQLQGENEAFDNALAFQMIAEDIGWSGALAPGCPHAEGAPGPTLFAQLSNAPVAAASLAQVYYAVTHDGKELAIKVQRPGLLRCVALDMFVLRLLLDAARRLFSTVADLRVIADEVGAGVFRELDVHGEAANAAEFSRRLAFLGFVRTPGWEPRYSGPRGTARVLAMEWVRGRKLQQLPPLLQRRFVDMAVEASVAQLIRTGFVRACPRARRTPRRAPLTHAPPLARLQTRTRTRATCCWATTASSSSSTSSIVQAEFSCCARLSAPVRSTFTLATSSGPSASPPNPVAVSRHWSSTSLKFLRIFVRHFRTRSTASLTSSSGIVGATSTS